MSNDFSSKEAFEFLQKLWNPMMPSMPNMFAALNPQDIEKKIVELKAIEGWLTTNLQFLQMTIKTLEMQKMTIETMQKNSNQDTSGNK